MKNIVGAFPNWFRTDFNQFADKVTRLPVDQHMLMALVAPRHCCSRKGRWTRGRTRRACSRPTPPRRRCTSSSAAGDRINIRYRPVGHIPSNDDLLDYADFVFAKKPLPAAFGKLEYKEDKKAFSWDVPK